MSSWTELTAYFSTLIMNESILSKLSNIQPQVGERQDTEKQSLKRAIQIFKMELTYLVLSASNFRLTNIHECLSDSLHIMGVIHSIVPITKSGPLTPTERSPFALILAPFLPGRSP